MSDDEQWMNEAITLAAHGRGSVEPNPLVGAVIVREGEIIGRGWHFQFGGPHAEVHALNEAGDRARGATLYVSLEPCCHHGKTPPCTDAVIRAGVGRVVVAMADPFPAVSGQGIARLTNANIPVALGVGEAKARRLNRPYLTLIQKGRPYVHLKWAMSLDGKLATTSGDSKWISGRESRTLVHELRGRVDAIIVGAGTVRADDPLLTARPPGPRRATRVVLSTQPRLPEGCQLLKTLDQAPVVVATCSDVGAETTPENLEYLNLPALTGGLSVHALLSELGRRRMTNVLVEGGPQIIGSFLDAQLVDEVHAFIAPMILGGTAANNSIGGAGAKRIQDALRLTDTTVERIGEDIYIRGVTAAAAGI